MPYIIGYMRDFEDIITRNTEANANTAVRGIITILLKSSWILSTIIFVTHG